MLANSRMDFDRGTLVLVTLFVASLNWLIVAVVLPDPLITHLALIALVIYLLLAAMVLGLGAVSFAAHSMIACSFCLFASLISQSGGINSPAMVWLPSLTIAALLLINLKWAVVWIGIIVLHNAVQFMAAKKHWINVQVDATVIPEMAVFWVRVNVLVFIMLALGLYETTFRRSKQSLALRNAELETLQAARHEAQNQIDALILSLGQHLRAPVQKIATLQSHLEWRLSPMLGQSPQQIQGLTEHIVELVNQVLDIAQYETRNLALKHAPFCVQQVVSDLVSTPPSKASEQTIASKTQIHFQEQGPLWVMGDGLRFTQVLRHVLNRVQRRAAGHPIQLLAGMQGPMLHVQVQLLASGERDTTGRDFESEDGSRAQDWEHALCERLLTLVGATLSEMKDVDTTSGIELHWPAQVCDAPPSSTKSVAAPEKKSLRFLLVDDQPKRLSELQSALRRQWPNALLGQSDNGESALLQLEFERYDLVLMALHMQNLDGLETTRRMRQHVKTELRSVPVIGLCDKEFAHHRQRYLAAGMQWLLFRPLQEKQIVQLIRLHLPEGPM